MVRQHYQSNGHESEHSPGDSEGQDRGALYAPVYGVKNVGLNFMTKQQLQNELYQGLTF